MTFKRVCSIVADVILAVAPYFIVFGVGLMVGFLHSFFAVFLPAVDESIKALYLPWCGLQLSSVC